MTALFPSRRAGRPLGAPETREQCLAAAERLFADGGFAGTGMRDIAAAAGVTVATLAYHFGSKEKLYGAVLGGVAGSILPYLPAPAAAAGTPEEVAAMAGRFLDWALDHPHLACLLMRELMENPERAQRARRFHLRPVIDAYAEAIARGQASGSIAACDGPMLAFYIAGAITHFCAAAPTIQRMLDLPGRDTTVARFRATLRASTLAMLEPR